MDLDVRLDLIRSDRWIAFDRATRPSQLATLEARWCEVITASGNGWLPGRYLVPEQN